MPGRLQRQRIILPGASVPPVVGAWASGGSLLDDVNVAVAGSNSFTSQNAGQTWSLQYAPVVDHYRFDVRSGDIWSGDSTNNRSEAKEDATHALAATVWVAYSFMVESGAAIATDWAVVGQFHDQTSVNNPSIAVELTPTGKLRVVRRESDGTFHNEWETTLTRNNWYDFVIQFKADPTGASSTLNVWVDGTQRVSLSNVSIGASDATAHYWKFGYYRSGSTETTAVRYANMECGAADLSARVSSPLPLTTARVDPPAAPLEGTSPTLAISFRQQLLSSYAGDLYRISGGTSIDRAYDQSSAAQTGIAAGAGQPTLVTQDSIDAASFDGTDDVFSNWSAASSIVTATAWYMIAVVYIDAIGSDDATSAWNNDQIAGDGAGYIGIGLRSTGPVVQAWIDDGSNSKASASITTGAWHTVEAYQSGGNIYVRVDGGSWTSSTAGTISDLTNSWRVGRGQTGSNLDFKLADYAVYNTALDDTTRNAIQAALAPV